MFDGVADVFELCALHPDVSWLHAEDGCLFAHPHALAARDEAAPFRAKLSDLGLYVPSEGFSALLSAVRTGADENKALHVGGFHTPDSMASRSPHKAERRSHSALSSARPVLAHTVFPLTRPPAPEPHAACPPRPALRAPVHYIYEKRSASPEDITRMVVGRPAVT